jgi:MFS family permease
MTTVSANNPAVGSLAEAPGSSFTHAYRYYIVAVVWLVMLLRFVDLQIVAVLLESIRADFHVSDTKLGLLGGTAFALFYAILGLPVAWLADRYSRRNIIAACLGIWSVMTALCGTAGSFLGLFMARVGVGFGEAGGVPPAYSLISDYFAAPRRSTIFAILNSAVPVGVFAGYFIGGYLNVTLGWRATIAIIGLFGVVVATVVRFTVHEPRRGSSDAQRASATPRAAETVRYLWNLRSYRHLVLGSAVFTLGAYGSGTWIASFFIRVHHMAPFEVTTWLAFLYGAGGLVGALLGGAMADRISRRTGDERWQAWLPAACVAAIQPFLFFVYLASNPRMALLVHIGTTVLMHSWMGPVYATVQSLVGASRRAFSAGLNLLVVNVLALGFGPLIVGAMSDLFGARLGGDALRYSILGLSVVTYAWGGVHFLLAGRTLREDLLVASVPEPEAAAA